MEQPKVLIRGDIRMCVSESEAILHPITGHFKIETEAIRKPQQVIWNAEGRVITGGATSTDIEFDVCGARAGQTRTYLVTVQVMRSESDGHCCIISGVFVQIHVTGEESPSCYTFDSNGKWYTCGEKRSI
jgi:hypothetical protein